MKIYAVRSPAGGRPLMSVLGDVQAPRGKNGSEAVVARAGGPGGVPGNLDDSKAEPTRKLSKRWKASDRISNSGPPM